MENLLNTKEAVEFLGIGDDDLMELVDSKVIPAYTIGGEFLRFKKEELEALKDMLYEGRDPGNGRIFHQAFEEVKGFERFKEALRANDIYLVAGGLIFLIVMALMLIK